MSDNRNLCEHWYGAIVMTFTSIYYVVAGLPFACIALWLQRRAQSVPPTYLSKRVVRVGWMLLIPTAILISIGMDTLMELLNAPMPPIKAPGIELIGAVFAGLSFLSSYFVASRTASYNVFALLASLFGVGAGVILLICAGIDLYEFRFTR